MPSWRKPSRRRLEPDPKALRGQIINSKRTAFETYNGRSALASGTAVYAPIPAVLDNPRDRPSWVERRHSPQTPRLHGRRQVFGFRQLAPGWRRQVHPFSIADCSVSTRSTGCSARSYDRNWLEAHRVVIVPYSPTPVSFAFTAGGFGDHRLEIISLVSGPTAGARRRWRSPFAAAAWPRPAWRPRR
jgi:hypothetical protein